MKRAGFLSVILASTGFLATFSLALHAGDERTFPVEIRHAQNEKPRPEMRSLEDLVSNEAFEGKIFKVVLGKSDAPIRFDSDSETVLRAATIYYHMNLARNWFLARPEFQVEPFRSALNEPLTVRLDIDVPFSGAIHFRSDGTHAYNGCGTFIPSRDWEKDDDTPAWGHETWFYKPAIVKDTSTANYIGKVITSPSFKDGLRSNLLYGDMIELTQDAMDKSIDPVIHLINVGFSLGLSEVIPDVLGFTLKFFKQRQYLDAAKVPEISYHEYTHTVLSNVFEPTMSSALNEGYANYFASKISGFDQLAGHVGRDISKGFMAKKGRSNSRYTLDEDYSKRQAYGSFAMSVLLNFDQVWKDDAIPVLVGALTVPNVGLTTDSRLKPDLERAIKASIKVHAPNASQEALMDLDLGAVIRDRQL